MRTERRASLGRVVVVVGAFFTCACSTLVGITSVDIAEAGADAIGVETGSCTGLAAAAAGLTFPPACLTCLGTNCCALAQACVAEPGCKTILACEATCVSKGISGITCGQTCIPDKNLGTDAATSGLDAAQQAAYALDLCIFSMGCSTSCTDTD
jgi:hypothetical protein